MRAITYGLAAVLLLAGAEQIQAQEAVKCEVKITTPRPGDQVGKDGWVRGTATIPDGTHLWVLAHLRDLVAEWWPQGGRPAVIEADSTWVIRTRYGEPPDVHEQFEVAAVVVDGNTNTRIRNWVETAPSKGYPPIEFPDAVDGCVPVKVKVTKASP
jgi:hypothetical protein